MKKNTISIKDIYKQNKRNVLHLIRSEDKITSSEIIERTGLNDATIDKILSDLINKEKLVSAKLNKGGSRKTILSFNYKDNYAIGIDLGTTYIRGALFNLNAGLITRQEIPTQLEKGFDGVMNQVAELIKELSDDLASNKKVVGVGIAVGGLVNKNTGMMEYSPVFNWKEVNIVKALKDKIDFPVFYDNVSRLTALGELWCGIGKEKENFITVNLGYGIGAGIIADGKPFYGAEGYSGEVGHVILELNSHINDSSENLHGTLEGLSSGYGIAQIIKDTLKEGHPSILTDDPNVSIDDIDAKMVIEAAMQRDTVALKTFDKAITYMGVGIDILVKLFNPECIVLSGGLTYSGDFFMNRVQEEVKRHNMKGISTKLTIVNSSFGKNAALVGAFSLVLTKIFDFEIDL